MEYAGDSDGTAIFAGRKDFVLEVCIIFEMRQQVVLDQIHEADCIEMSGNHNEVKI